MLCDHTVVVGACAQFSLCYQLTVTGASFSCSSCSATAWRAIIAFLHAQIRPPPDEQHLPLSFDFPEGSLIGIAKEKLPVTVTFTGTRPTSFTANVVFLDEDGKRFSLPITGTTDASVLTVKSFLEVRAYVLTSPACIPASRQKSNSFERERRQGNNNMISCVLVFFEFGGDKNGYM